MGIFLKLVYGDKPVCELASDSLKTGIELGAKYNCEVKPGKTYTFYVLSNNNDGTTNLIMDQNINSDGTPAGMTGIEQNGENIYNLVAWISNSDYRCDGDYCTTTEKGPITAMRFLYNATKSWTNVNPINYIYNDKEEQEPIQGNTSYTSFSKK